MNGEILNLSAIHNGGKPELNVGIRGNSFTIKLSEDKTSLQFVDVNGNKLKLDGELLLQALGLIYLSTSIPSSDDYLPVFNGNDKIAKSNLTLTELMSQLNKINNKADKAITLDGYGIKNAYTKTQIDNMLVSIMKYKGTYASFELLTSDVADGTITPTVGDVYNITNAGGTDASGIEINAGDNVVYNGTGWDNFGGAFDASELASKTEVTTEISQAISNLSAEVAQTYLKIADMYSKSQLYTKDEVYNKAEINGKLSNMYSKSQVYTKDEVYNKSEVDGKLTGALHYKGTYATFSALTTAVSSGTITPSIGDVYNITNAGGTDSHGTEIKAGDNVIYNGTGWDCSSGTIDLSGYATSSSLNSATSELETSIQEVSSDLSTLSSTVSGHTSTISSMQTSLNNKATKSTTLSGYGITNAYTKTEVDSKDTTIKNSIPKVTVSTTPPTSSSSGKTGDIWIVYEA